MNDIATLRLLVVGLSCFTAGIVVTYQFARWSLWLEHVQIGTRPKK